MKLRYGTAPTAFYLFCLVFLIFFVLSKVETAINPLWFDLQTMEMIRNYGAGR